MTKILDFENITFASSIAKVVRNGNSLYGKITPNILKEINYSDGEDLIISYGVKSKAVFDRFGFPHWDRNDKFSFSKSYGNLKKLANRNSSKYFLINNFFAVFNDLKNEDNILIAIMTSKEFKKLHTQKEKEKTPEDTMTKKHTSGNYEKTNTENNGVVSYE